MYVSCIKVNYSYKLSFLVGPRLEQLGTGKGPFGVNYFFPPELLPLWRGGQVQGVASEKMVAG